MYSDSDIHRIASAFRAMRVDSASIDEVADLAGVESERPDEEIIKEVLSVMGLQYDRGFILKLGLRKVVKQRVAQTGYREFIEACRDVIDMASEPMPATTLISAIGLTGCAIPSNSFRTVLKSSGIHLIPGLGFWKYNHFCRKDGRFVAAHMSGRKMREVCRFFHERGWPGTVPQIAAWTDGKADLRYISQRGSLSNADTFVLREKLVIPVMAWDLWEKDGVTPVTRAIAEELISHNDKPGIIEDENPVMYYLFNLLGKAGLVSVRNEPVEGMHKNMTRRSITIRKQDIDAIRTTARLNIRDTY